MPLNTRVLDLLLRWEEGREQGQSLTPEELCRDCPELLPEVRQRLQQLHSLAYLIDKAGEALVPPPGSTVLTASPEAAQPAVASAAPRYRRLRFHARGGLGEVYVGLDQELNREVALKRIQRPIAIHPEAHRRFLREAEVTGRLEHPGVVPVYGLVQDDDGMPCYAMRFIRGESLEDAIHHFHEADRDRRDPGQRSLAFRELLTRFIAVCKTIAYAHSRGILHRDLKPANVMLGPYGETLVVDWGLARPFTHAADTGGSGEQMLTPALEEGTEATHLGQTLGTPAYMSPEQAAGRWDVIGPASDLYSLGATLYTLLTNRAPFSATNPEDIVRKVQQGEFPSPREIKPTVPAALQAVCLKAMARKPEDRYATALELADEVEHWLADEPVRAYREPLRVRTRRWLRRHKPLAAATATLLLTVLVLSSGGVVWLQHYYVDLRKGTEMALVTAAGLRDAARWQAAQDIVQQAEDRLGSTGPADLRQRVAQARAGVELAKQLEEIRLRRATLVAGKVDNRGADRDYAAAFRAAGLGVEGEEAEAVAARIHASVIGEQLVATLDDWAAVTDDVRRRDWLLEVARYADPDPWRNRFRDPAVWRDPAVLEALVDELLHNETNLTELKPQLLTALGNALRALKGNPLPLLAAAQLRHADDFWLNHSLGLALTEVKQWEAAISFFRGALAIRPDSVPVYTCLGGALAEKGQWDEALRVFRSAPVLNPDYAPLHSNIGSTLYYKYKEQVDEAILDEAIREFHTAIDLDPELAPAHYNLGHALARKGQLNEAIKELRAALDLDPKYAEAHLDLGNVLRLQYVLGLQKKPDEAIQKYREALAINPQYAEAYLNLGELLHQQGQLAEALAALRKAHRLGSQQPGWRYNSEGLVRRTERLLLDRKLPALLEGKEKPADDTERLALARLCQEPLKKLYAASVRFYREAFAHDAKLADDLQKQHRYNAACAAALAGCGQGKDASALDDQERARLRQQALAWLQADLALWANQADQEDAKIRAAIQQMLCHWQTDADLAGIRDPDALKKLPEAERNSCRKLWDDVAAVQAKIEDRGSRIEDRGSRIEDRGSRIEDRGSKIERNSAEVGLFRFRIPILDSRSSILDPRSSIFDLRSSIFDPRFSTEFIFRPARLDARRAVR
jgi:serine/threonine-protein kinase